MEITDDTKSHSEVSESADKRADNIQSGDVDIDQLMSNVLDAPPTPCVPQYQGFIPRGCSQMYSASMPCTITSCPQVYLLMDENGLIGVFNDKQEVHEICNSYTKTNILIFKYSLNPALPSDIVYALPYVGTNMIALVSNDKQAVYDLQQYLLKINLVDPDSVDRFTLHVGEIHQEAAERLTFWQKYRGEEISDDDRAVIQMKLNMIEEEGRELIEESEKISVAKFIHVAGETLDSVDQLQIAKELESVTDAQITQALQSMMSCTADTYYESGGDADDDLLLDMHSDPDIHSDPDASYDHMLDGYSESQDLTFVDDQSLQPLNDDLFQTQLAEAIAISESYSSSK